MGSSPTNLSPDSRVAGHQNSFAHQVDARSIVVNTKATFSDFGQRLRGFGEGFLANVCVAMAHRRALVANQRHHNGIRDTGILEQRNRAVWRKLWKLVSIPVRLPPLPKNRSRQFPQSKGREC
jgi:hypothetical protein